MWKGCGGSSPQNTSSSVKLQVQFNLLYGTLIGPILQHGRERPELAKDQSSPLDNQTLPSGALRITDLGYFSLQKLFELMKASILIRKHATNIAFAFAIGTMERLIEAIEMIQQCLKRCRINNRKKRPNTYQLLMGIEET